MKQALRILAVTVVASVVLGLGGFRLGRWSMQKTWLDDRAKLEGQLRDMAHELKELNNFVRNGRMANKKKQDKTHREMMARLKQQLQTKSASKPSTRPGVPPRPKTKAARKPPTPAKARPKPASKPTTARVGR